MDWQNEPWAWETPEEYQKNNASVFRRWAQSHGYKIEAPQDRFLQDVVGQPQQKQQIKKSGGGLGGVLGGLGKVAEVTRLKDVAEVALKPFEWEHKYISKPAVRGLDIAARGISTPIRMATRGESLEEAWEKTGRPEVQPPGWARATTEAAVTPSMWVGAGVGAKGVRAIGAGVQAAKPLISGRVAAQAARVKTAKTVVEYEAAIAGSKEPQHILYRAMKAIKEVTPERGVAVHAERVRQAAQMRGITKQTLGGKYGIPEAERMMQAARKGKMAAPEFEPIGQQLTKSQITGMKRQIFQHWDDANLHHNIPNTSQALDKLLVGGEWVTPYERKLLGEVFGGELKQLLDAFTPWQRKAFGAALNVLGVPRVVQASTDISFALRQGVMLAVRHPKEWARSAVTNAKIMFRTLKNPEYTDDVFRWVDELKNQGRISQKIRAPSPGGPVGQRPEPFVESILEKVPGVRRIVLASEQAYGGAGAKLRAEYALTLAEQWKKTAGLKKLTVDQIDEIGEMVNYATGAGPIPERLAGLLSQLFYAPRFTTAKPAWVAKFFNPNTPAFIRKQMAYDMVGFVGGGFALLQALKFSGVADVEYDPRSSDFGKIRIGKIRLDMWGGWQPYARYTTQLLTGQRKTIGTGEIIGANTRVVAENFIRSKLSPQFAIATDVWLGETYMGEEMTPTPETMKTQAWNRMVPLAVQDLVEATEEGRALGLLGGLAFMGVGMQAFETPGQKVARIAKDNHGVEWREISQVPRQRLIDQDPELAEAYQEQMLAAEKWGKVGVPKLWEFDAETEVGIKKLIQQEGTTEQMVVNYWRDRLTKRSNQSELWFAESPDYDPRDELEQGLDRLDAIPFPETGTVEDKDLWWERRDAILSEPNTLRAWQDRQLLRHKDPEVRGWIQRYHQAQEVRGQYYDIPSFRGISLEEGRQVQRLLNEADALAGLDMAPNRDAALRMIARERPEMPRRLFIIAFNAENLRNPQRRQFKLQNQDAFAMFEPLELDVW